MLGPEWSLALDGIENAVTNCMRIQRGEQVVIITDNATLELATIFFQRIAEITPGSSLFIMEHFGQRPIAMPDEIMERLRTADASFYIATYVDGELPIFREPIFQWVVQSGHLRHAHMPHLSKQMLEQGMRADYGKVAKITERFYQRLQGAKKISVITGAGTNLQIEVGKYKWVKCDGNIQPGTFSNLPDGEVFTAPVNVNGTLVLDGFIDMQFRKYGDLYNTPLEVKIQDCVVDENSIDSYDTELALEFLEYFTENPVPNKNRVGEVAFGTNPAIHLFIGAMLQDEKRLGTMHIAFGDAIPEDTGSPYSCEYHLDCVFRNPTVCVDNRRIMTEGRIDF